MQIEHLHECTNPTVLIGKIPVSDTYVTYLRDSIKRTPDGFVKSIKKKALTICERYARIPIIVPCGKCLQCRLRKQNEWNTRIMCEKDCTEFSMFITLTINPEHYPIFVDKETGEECDYMNTNLGKNVYYPYIQKFFKRLRKANLKFRYYVCAEYGDNHGRLHFHVILFFLQPESVVKSWVYSWLSYHPDIKVRPYFVNSSPKNKRRNARLQTYFEAAMHSFFSDKYKIGFVEKVQMCNAECARYVTKYVTKSLEDEKANKCPFHRQSLGLGTQWINTNKRAIGSGSLAPIMPNNNRGDFSYYCRIPKYYLTKYIKAYGDYFSKCQELVRNNSDNYQKQMRIAPPQYNDLYHFKLDYNYGIYKSDVNPRIRQNVNTTCFSPLGVSPVTDEFMDDRISGLSLDLSQNSVATKFGICGLDNIISKWKLRFNQNSRRSDYFRQIENRETDSVIFPSSLWY